MSSSLNIKFKRDMLDLESALIYMNNSNLYNEKESHLQEDDFDEEVEDATLLNGVQLNFEDTEEIEESENEDTGLIFEDEDTDEEYTDEYEEDLDIKEDTDEELEFTVENSNNSLKEIELEGNTEEDIEDNTSEDLGIILEDDEDTEETEEELEFTFEEDEDTEEELETNRDTDNLEFSFEDDTEEELEDYSNPSSLEVNSNEITNNSLSESKLNEKLAEKDNIIKELRDELQRKNESNQIKLEKELAKAKEETNKKAELAEKEKRKRIELENKIKRLNKLKEQKLKEIREGKLNNESNIEKYNAMEINALYKEVKNFIIKNGATNKPIDKDVITKVFGADNVRRLHRRGYIVMVGRNITCGRD